MMYCIEWLNNHHYLGAEIPVTWGDLARLAWVVTLFMVWKYIR